MRVSMTRIVRTAGAMALLATLGAGCAGNSWEVVRERDTVAAYNRFVRENPEASQVDNAYERIEFLRVRTAPSLERYHQFAGSFPRSEMLDELGRIMEPKFFEAARAANTSASYRDFMARYPTGELLAKARGNLSYVASVRNEPIEPVLGAFIDAHPESDFVEEARITLKLLEFRRATQISRLGVQVEVGPNVVQATRVRRGFASVVNNMYGQVGIEVIMMAPGEGLPAGVDGYVRVDYHEAPASGVFGGTLLSSCRVRVYHNELEEPIWDRSFDAPADHILKGAYGRDRTVFANSKFRFWEKFFVPVPTWAVSSSRVYEKRYQEEVKALDVVGDRAALLLERGGVDLLDVSSPLKPVVIARYRRESDLAHWTGVNILDASHTLIYGPDGAELLVRTRLGVDRVGRWQLSEIGSVRGAASYDSNTALLATSQGLYAARLTRSPVAVHLLLDGDYVGVEVHDGYVYLVRPDRVEVAAPKHLLRHMTGARTSIGKHFGAKRSRLQDGRLFVFGKSEIAELSLANPARPSVISSLPVDKLGEIDDVAPWGNKLFVVGDRGLQVTSSSGQWVTDSIQVKADNRVHVAGRFAFLVGGNMLEVYDLTPYYERSQQPASITPER